MIFGVAQIKFSVKLSKKAGFTIAEENYKSNYSLIANLGLNFSFLGILFLVILINWRNAMQKDDGRQVLKAFSMVGTLGINMAATVAVGLFLGRWIDSLLDSRPWATVAGIIIGMFAGLWSAFKIILKK